MIKMEIYEPAMCCPTGLCGPSVDPDLLRISAVMSKLEKSDSEAVRYNLTNDPQAFVDNGDIGKMIADKGIEVLPITLIDGQVKKTAAYPTNEEISEWLDVPMDMLKDAKDDTEQSGDCCCGSEEEETACCGAGTDGGCC